jgi:hypothetical protein
VDSTIFGGHKPPLQQSAPLKVGWKAPRDASAI